MLGLFADFADAPTGKLCAYKTSDGDTTNIYYDNNGNLSRVVMPGGQVTDYSYDSYGRISAVRDSTANDALAAGIRSNDESILTSLSYDSLGRVHKVVAPAAQNGANRLTHTLKYKNNHTDISIDGASEPKGYSRRVEYDTLLRTVADHDLSGKVAKTEWHEAKDIQLSTTDARGKKSTMIYDADDRQIEAYGPAPTDWYDANRTPKQQYRDSVPRTSTRYDENMKGPAVSWYNLRANSMTLIGAPKAHTTGFASNNPPENGNPAYMRHDFRSQELPFTIDSGYDGYGFIATGKLRFPQSGTYSFKAISDDSVRLLIDDTQILGNWGTKTAGNNQNILTGTFRAEAGKVYRFQYQYGHEGAQRGTMGLDITGPGLSGDARDWSSILSPGYNLKTSSKAYDAQAGDVETKTVYKNPAYGLVEKTVLDPGGLNYESKADYEAPGAGFLRQTSKTLPGGAKTTYLHYGTNDMRDNPCTPENDPAPQAGRAKGKIEPDPDGDGPQQGRRSETIYNHGGDVVATRYNDDAWTCTEYDARGRVTKTTVPTRSENGQTLPGRTITNDYAVGGNPLITSTTDASGTITVENDLLGRTVKYTDAKDHVTTNTYDAFGKLTQRTSPLGTESYEYDQFDRLTKHKLDGVTFATVTYDEFSDVSNIDYPAGIKLGGITRDQLGRENSNTYTLANGQQIVETVERHVSGDIKQGSENGINKSYTYDNAGRLIAAQIGDNNFAYEFGQPDAACQNIPGHNPHTAKNGNRTKLTINGQSTTFCYDQADRLISASDPSLTSAQYDSHGNTTSLGDDTHKTAFGYDAADRNLSIRAGNKQTIYDRDAQDRIISREVKQGSETQSLVKYGFTGSGDSPDFLTNGAGEIVEKYLILPGDVIATIKPNVQSAGATTFSLPNIHGDTMATVNADGALTGSFMTGPFGEALPNQTHPNNTAEGTTWNYVGQHQKLTETESSPIPGGIIQMGARVYIPILGRFLQVDPVEGGTDNNYVYANDPVNEFDLDGKWARSWWRNTKKAVKGAAKWAWRNREGISAVVGTAACVIGTAGVCGGVAVATAIISGVAAGYYKYRQTRSFRKAAFTGIKTGVRDYAIGWTAGKIAGAKYVARYFGKIRKTGTLRYYRSFGKAWKKAPVRKRAYRQIWAGAMSYGYQKWRR